jgi:hypothetical protein
MTHQCESVRLPFSGDVSTKSRTAHPWPFVSGAQRDSIRESSVKATSNQSCPNLRSRRVLPLLRRDLLRSESRHAQRRPDRSSNEHRCGATDLHRMPHEVRGYFQYQAVPRNEERLKAFRHEVLRMW